MLKAGELSVQERFKSDGRSDGRPCSVCLFPGTLEAADVSKFRQVSLTFFELLGKRELCLGPSLHERNETGPSLLIRNNMQRLFRCNDTTFVGGD